MGKDVFPSCHMRGTKKTFQVLMRNQSSDLQILRHEESNVFTKHDANDIADPSSIQDVCHILTS